MRQQDGSLAALGMTPCLWQTRFGQESSSSGMVTGRFPVVRTQQKRQLVLVVVQVKDLRAGNRGEGGGGIVVGRALELDGADEVPDQIRCPPALDQTQQARRV